ncbi:hypothetical protein VFPBJ_03556 [Purpureocillium lilacinum]|uniref:Uncharacterized protein n=1 Tax=Purpureocillium lilacinum TaxID=33203 RepID=A0A179H4V4_PURLI|nr:hypothetical protein VFPBJ_03556 [Purpureocillium lilacinum]
MQREERADERDDADAQSGSGRARFDPGARKSVVGSERKRTSRTTQRGRRKKTLAWARQQREERDLLEQPWQ